MEWHTTRLFISNENIAMSNIKTLNCRNAQMIKRNMSVPLVESVVLNISLQSFSFQHISYHNGEGWKSPFCVRSFLNYLEKSHIFLEFKTHIKGEWMNVKELCLQNRNCSSLPSRVTAALTKSHTCLQKSTCGRLKRRIFSSKENNSNISVFRQREIKEAIFTFSVSREKYSTPLMHRL